MNANWSWYKETGWYFSIFDTFFDISDSIDQKHVDIYKCKYVYIKLVQACWGYLQFAFTNTGPFL